MGTSKRERQKANRLQRQLEEARAERVGSVKRNVVRWGIGGVVALAAVVAIAWVGGAFDGDDDQISTGEAFDVTQSDVADVTDDGSADDAASQTPVGGTTPADPATGKPSVALPTELPTELVITDVVEGSGDPAAAGDTVLVNYVGVRSVDGVEFDNSYDRGAPFEVALGTGGVIQGWDQGLIGVKAGGQRQLDIPAELAYGDADRGTIRPGDALSFVIDVVSITPADG